MTTSEIISAAQLHLSRAESRIGAAIALSDAIWCYAQGFDRSARLRAIDSLAYSVGLESALYKLARVESLSESARLAESQAFSFFFGI